MSKNLLWLCIGAAAGYAAAYLQLEKRHQENLDREIEDARLHYARRYRKRAAEEGEDPGLTDAAVDASEALRDYQGVKVGPSVLTQELSHTIEAENRREALKKEIRALHDSEPAPKVPDAVVDGLAKVQESIIDDGPAKPVDYKKLSAPVKKTEEEPEEVSEETPPKLTNHPSVVITEDEFLNSEYESDRQVALSFFAGDDKLADATDEIIPDESRDKFIGWKIVHDHLQLKASDPRDILYVRNPDLRMEFEVSRTEDTYLKTVGPYPQKAAG